MAGYAEGLFWLHRFHVPGKDSTGSIWNPSLRKAVHIPTCPSFHETPHYKTFHVAGFGFDPLTDDYKAVIIRSFYNDNIPSVFTEVYSLRSGSWRSLDLNAIPKDQVSIIRLKGSRHVYANGSIHWLSPDRLNNANFTHVVSFDLGRELFRFRELPGQDGRYDPYETVVQLPMSYRGSFAVCYISKFHIYVWVMLEDGWVQQHVSDSSHDFYCSLCNLYYDGNHRLFCGAIFSEDTGELLIAWHKKGVISYNLSSQRRTVFHRRVNHMYLNVDSLRWEELLPSDTA